jgi:nitrite reductase/ring-hydroxylating ferredoxin subunit
MTARAARAAPAQKPKIARYLGVDEGLAAGADPALSGWTELKGVDATTCFLSKPIKPVILANNQAICLYKVSSCAHHEHGNNKKLPPGRPMRVSHSLRQPTRPPAFCAPNGCPPPPSLPATPSHVQVDDRVYCTDAASPAYKYPLADANLLSLKTGPAVESPLDGSVFDLASGRVLSWCPKNNALRSVLGALKDKAEPTDLKTFPVEVKGGAVYVKLT